MILVGDLFDVHVFGVSPELQIRGDIEDISKTFFLFLNENLCSDPLLEPSRRIGSNDG